MPSSTKRDIVDGSLAIYVRWLFRAGVTCLRYTVLISPKKDETVVHCCNPAFIGSCHVWCLQTSFTKYQPYSLLFVFNLVHPRKPKVGLAFCDCPVWTLLLPSPFNFSGSFYSRYLLSLAFHFLPHGMYVIPWGLVMVGFCYSIPVNN